MPARRLSTDTSTGSPESHPDPPSGQTLLTLGLRSFARAHWRRRSSTAWAWSACASRGPHAWPRVDGPPHDRPDRSTPPACASRDKHNRGAVRASQGILRSMLTRPWRAVHASSDRGGDKEFCALIFVARSPPAFRRRSRAAAMPLTCNDSPSPRRKPDRGVMRSLRLVRPVTSAARSREHGCRPPRFVGRELDHYLLCGVFAFGFARVPCASCGRDDLAAFPCRGRGFCPSWKTGTCSMVPRISSTESCPMALCAGKCSRSRFAFATWRPRIQDSSARCGAPL